MTVTTAKGAKQSFVGAAMTGVVDKDMLMQIIEALDTDQDGTVSKVDALHQRLSHSACSKWRVVALMSA